MFKDKGFTLLELLLAVSIASILISIGIPSFESTLLRARGVAVVDKLTMAIYFVRSEAISRNQEVRLCTSDDFVICNGTAINWNSGWIAIDVNNNVLKSWPLTEPGANVQFLNANAASNHNLHVLAFKSDGTAIMRNLANAQIVADVRFSSQINGCSGLQKRDINIVASGMVQVTTQSCT